MSLPMPEDSPGTGHRWYQGVSRYAWLVLVIAALGWMFDAMDQNLFTLVRQVSVTELLKSDVSPANLNSAVTAWGGMLTSIFLIGWAVGGFVFGMLGDRLGRTRTMILTICIYALFTGLNGLAQNMWQYALCRFLTALGVGGEFAAGAALVAEVWPERSRPMALGMLQSLSALGNIAAAAINFKFAGDWRFVYFVGAVPALLVLWIRASVKEPKRWQEAQAAAEKDGTARELGNIAALFREPTLRRNTIAGVLLALAGVGGLWGVGFFLPDLVGSVLKPLVSGLSQTAQTTQIAKWRSEVFFVQQIGAFLGMFSYAALSERTGRRPALLLFFILAFFAVQGTFWGVHDLMSARLWGFTLGFCALAPFSAYAVYLPELYPTRLRATGIGFCYNCARLLAALAPFALGSLAATLHPEDKVLGLRAAASIVACIYAVGLAGLALAPETRGKPLPE